MEKPLSASINNFILEFINRSKGTKGENIANVIFCYHSISDDNWIFSVTPWDFEEQIRGFLKITKIVPLNSLVENIGNKSYKGSAITFDDGYEDVYKNAFPILKKYGLNASVFVIGDIDKVNRDQLGCNKKLLSINQIKELKDNGWEIGYHSKTHRYFRNIKQKDLEKEIIDGKRNLERKLGFRIQYFAYPRGIYSKKIIDVVKKAGFKAAFTVKGGAVEPRKCPYELERMVANRFMKTKHFPILLTHWGASYNRFMTRILTLKDGFEDFARKYL